MEDLITVINSLLLILLLVMGLWITLSESIIKGVDKGKNGKRNTSIDK